MGITNMAKNPSEAEKNKVDGDYFRSFMNVLRDKRVKLNQS